MSEEENRAVEEIHQDEEQEHHDAQGEEIPNAVDADEGGDFDAENQHQAELEEQQHANQEHEDVEDTEITTAATAAAASAVTVSNQLEQNELLSSEPANYSQPENNEEDHNRLEDNDEVQIEEEPVKRSNQQQQSLQQVKPKEEVEYETPTPEHERSDLHHAPHHEQEEDQQERHEGHSSSAVPEESNQLNQFLADILDSYRSTTRAFKSIDKHNKGFIELIDLSAELQTHFGIDNEKKQQEIFAQLGNGQEMISRSDFEQAFQGVLSNRKKLQDQLLENMNVVSNQQKNNDHNNNNNNPTNDMHSKSNNNNERAQSPFKDRNERNDILNIFSKPPTTDGETYGREQNDEQHQQQQQQNQQRDHFTEDSLYAPVIKKLRSQPNFNEFVRSYNSLQFPKYVQQQQQQQPQQPQQQFEQPNANTFTFASRQPLHNPAAAGEHHSNVDNIQFTNTGGFINPTRSSFSPTRFYNSMNGSKERSNSNQKLPSTSNAALFFSQNNHNAAALQTSGLRTSPTRNNSKGRFLSPQYARYNNGNSSFLGFVDPRSIGITSSVANAAPVSRSLTNEMLLQIQSASAAAQQNQLRVNRSKSNSHLFKGQDNRRSGIGLSQSNLFLHGSSNNNNHNFGSNVNHNNAAGWKNEIVGSSKLAQSSFFPSTQQQSLAPTTLDVNSKRYSRVQQVQSGSKATVEYNPMQPIGYIGKSSQSNPNGGVNQVATTKAMKKMFDSYMNSVGFASTTPLSGMNVVGPSGYSSLKVPSSHSFKPVAHISLQSPTAAAMRSFGVNSGSNTTDDDHMFGDILSRIEAGTNVNAGRNKRSRSRNANRISLNSNYKSTGAPTTTTTAAAAHTITTLLHSQSPSKGGVHGQMDRVMQIKASLKQIPKNRQQSYKNSASQRQTSKRLHQ